MKPRTVAPLAFSGFKGYLISLPRGEPWHFMPFGTTVLSTERAYPYLKGAPPNAMGFSTPHVVP